MTIEARDFRKVGQDVLRPTVFVELSETRVSAPPGQRQQNVVFVGPVQDSISEEYDGTRAYPVESESVSNGLFGAGSPLARCISKAFEYTPNFRIWAVPRKAPELASTLQNSDISAEYSILPIATSGDATVNTGRLTFYVGGRPYSLRVLNGVSAQVIANQLVSLVNSDPACYFTAKRIGLSVADNSGFIKGKGSDQSEIDLKESAVAFLPKTSGFLTGNPVAVFGDFKRIGLVDLDITGETNDGRYESVNIEDGAQVDDACTVRVSSSLAQTHNSVSTSYYEDTVFSRDLENVDITQIVYVTNNANTNSSIKDSAVASLVKTELERRDRPETGEYGALILAHGSQPSGFIGHPFYSDLDALSSLTSFATGQDSKHVVVFDHVSRGSNYTWELASSLAGRIAGLVQFDPASPLQNTFLRGISLNPNVRRQNRPQDEREIALKNGVGTFKVLDGRVAIELAVTTFKTNDEGDNSKLFRHLNFAYTTGYLIWYLREYFGSKYSRAKLSRADVPLDRVPRNQIIVTPGVLKADAINILRDWEVSGLIQNGEGSQNLIETNVDSNEATRINASLNLEIIQSLGPIAVKINAR